MKIKNVNLEWLALNYNFNNKQLEWTNVLSNELKEDIAKLVHKKEIYNLESLKIYINKELMYSYWHKSEYEILVGNLFEEDIEKFTKIDIYAQLKPNLNRIVEYINRAMQLKLQ